MVDTIKTTAKRSGNGGLTIYIPRDLHVDSKNPIQIGNSITISVDGHKMVIEKTDPQINNAT